MYLIIYIKETNNATNSAKGIDSQIPSTFNNFGKNIIASIINTKVLRNDSKADIKPLENDVNNPEAKILNPMNKKLIPNKSIP